MNWQNLLTDGVVIALVYGAFELVKLVWNRGRDHVDIARANAELGKIDVETFVLLRSQVGEMEEKIIELRDRIELLEQERDETRHKFDVLRIWVKGLLKRLDAAGFAYDAPPEGLLDTGEHKAVKGGGK